MKKKDDMSEKDFLKTDLNYETVHYIEKRVRDGDQISDVHKDLKKIGTDSEKIAKHIDYVSKHRVKTSYHNIVLQLVFIICGVLIFSAIIGSLIYYYFI